MWQILCIGVFLSYTLLSLAWSASTSTIAVDLMPIPGGEFRMGDPAGEPDEVPRKKRVHPFRLMRFEVTNQQFAAFVMTTGYQTDAEKKGGGYVWTDRWRFIRGVNWRHPHGPDSSIAGKEDHPVVQVSWHDANAFCAYLGLRLPTEEEWEFAARGSNGRRYPWGDTPPEENGQRRANFGTIVCCAPDETDGFLRTAPVGSFPTGASPFALLDMAGNVWEWTASHHPVHPEQVILRGGGWGNNPYGLRTSYRHSNPPDIGLNMVGIRCAGDVQ